MMSVVADELSFSNEPTVLACFLFGCDQTDRQTSYQLQLANATALSEKGFASQNLISAAHLLTMTKTSFLLHLNPNCHVQFRTCRT
jgi:hypothetical protein